MLKVLILNGSIKEGSSNRRLITWLQQREMEIHQGIPKIEWITYEDIQLLPYFNPDLDKAPSIILDGQPEQQLPPPVSKLRNQLSTADGLLICTPEYVFSLPGILKNALEWLVSTTLLTDKPTALITAAASGEKAQQQLQLIMQTLGAQITTQTNVLIKGIAGKMGKGSDLDHSKSQETLRALLVAFVALMQTEK